MLILLSVAAYTFSLNDVSVPNKFTPSTPARSSEVNANFDTLASRINQNNDTIEQKFIRFSDLESGDSILEKCRIDTARIDHIRSNPEADSMTITKVDINGGTIDGTVIGANSAAAGTFTTVTTSGIRIPNGGLINDWVYLGTTHNPSSPYETRWYRVYELTGTGGADEDIELRVRGDVNYYYGSCIVRLKITRYQDEPANQLHVTITPISGWPSNALVKVDGGIVWVASNVKWGDIYGRLVQSRYNPGRVLFNTTYTQTEPAGVSIRGTFGVKTYNGDAQYVVFHDIDGANGNFTGQVSTNSALIGKTTASPGGGYKLEVEGNTLVNGTLKANIPAKSTEASVFLTHEENTIKTRTAAQVRADIGAAAVNHTQAISTVSGLQNALDSKLDKNHVSNNVYNYRSVYTIRFTGTTGTLKIKLPSSWNNMYYRFEMRGYAYSPNKDTYGSWRYVGSGYANSNNSRWYLQGGHFLEGNPPFNQVRYTHDGSRCCILLGDTTTTWTNYETFPVFIDIDVITGGSISRDGWSYEVLTSEDGCAWGNIQSITPSIYGNNAVIPNNALIGKTSTNKLNTGTFVRKSLTTEYTIIDLDSVTTWNFRLKTNLTSTPKVYFSNAKEGDEIYVVNELGSQPIKLLAADSSEDASYLTPREGSMLRCIGVDYNDYPVYAIVSHIWLDPYRELKP